MTWRRRATTIFPRCIHVGASATGDASDPWAPAMTLQAESLSTRPSMHRENRLLLV